MQFNPLSLVVVFCGAFMLFRLRLFPLLYPFRVAKIALHAMKQGRCRRALFLALAGTLGVGNVFGVAFGIIYGGAGSVFWMLISSVFAAVIKYSEVVISTDGTSSLSGEVHGGLTDKIARGFGKIGTPLATVYAASLLLVSLFMGASLQSASLIGVVSRIFNTPPTIISILLAITVFLTVVWGAKFIEKVTEIVIPLTTILYILLCLAVIITCRGTIGGALHSIILNAFSLRSGVGGVFGFLFSRALSEGFARGLLSNEAGAGTSSLAHSRGSGLNPALSGVMGVVEVLFDTVLICTLTALAILTAVPNIADFDSGIELIVYTFSSVLGSSAGFLLAAAVVAFAYSTIVCWYFYGSEAVWSLGGRSRVGFYLPIYLSFVLFGYRLSEGLLVSASDFLLLIMTLISTSLIIKSSDRILHLSESGGVIYRPGKYKSVKRILLRKAERARRR